MVRSYVQTKVVDLLKHLFESIIICDAAHEKVPDRRNGVISMVIQRTYQGIKQNKNHSQIPSTFRYIVFTRKILTKKFIQNWNKFTFNIFKENVKTLHSAKCIT